MSGKLQSFEVWYQGKFQFNARSVSSKRLKHTLWLYRGWAKEDIELKPDGKEKP